uniref:Uncharacterized protein n=1 Tax=Ixodes scapularis TaxID=6945 RepID=A0A4D5RYN3_IXOSC
MYSSLFLAFCRGFHAISSAPGRRVLQKAEKARSCLKLVQIDVSKRSGTKVENQIETFYRRLRVTNNGCDTRGKRIATNVHVMFFASPSRLRRLPPCSQASTIKHPIPNRDLEGSVTEERRALP